MRASSSNNTNYNKDRHLARIHFEGCPQEGKPAGHVKKGARSEDEKFAKCIPATGF